ncbi:hypothetical protein PCL1606_20970 [Pseudomonas chlororaphis]|uniref:Uncharacterized protein n=1 Tax=Pseudomonas chlororaphis TaxID=587753 RepID=A0A0D5XXK3_9PSED|nr:hypothetical protein PCL1606_20970 [Pseudomonas chlororaphis]
MVRPPPESARAGALNPRPRRSAACARWRPFWRCFFWMVYISIAAVTAAYGSALTAGHFGKAPK